jgi:uncharacterized membrane protein
MHMSEVLNVLMRWLHMISVAILIGGSLYGWLVWTRSAHALSSDVRESLGDSTGLYFRPLVLSAIIALVISGLYNVLTGPARPTLYHILLGIKLLLALHVFTVAILATRKQNPRRKRMMAGTAISGMIIVLISAYLRRIL